MRRSNERRINFKFFTLKKQVLGVLMKKLISVLVILALALTACGIQTPGAEDLPQVDTITSKEDTTDTEPVDTEPIETPPTETEPAESEPIESEAIETEPDESEPTETEPTDTDDALAQPTYSDPPKGVVYITFDDGPWTHTERVLEILDK